MKTCFYIDPIFLAVDKELWQGTVYQDGFLSFLSFFEFVIKIEKKINQKILRFLIDDNLMVATYEFNPFANSPKKSWRRYYAEILSQIFKRLSSCTYQNGNSPLNSSTTSQNLGCYENDHLPEKILALWNEMLNRCERQSSCTKSKAILYKSDLNTVIKSNFFEYPIDLSNKVEFICLFNLDNDSSIPINPCQIETEFFSIYDPMEFFPHYNDPYKVQKLLFALTILHKKSGDPISTRIIFLHNFWDSIKNVKEENIKLRILEVLYSLITGLNMAKYRPKRIGGLKNIEISNRESIPAWRIDIYQGPPIGPLRLYFGRKQDKLYISKYIDRKGYRRIS